MKLEPDDWLKFFFGYDVFQFAEIGQTNINQKEICSAIQPLCEAFCYVKIPAGRLEVLHLFLKSGFKIVDVNVTLTRKPEILKGLNLAAYTIRDATSIECEVVSAIAEISFTNSRFHKDPHIPTSVANLIKRKWVENYFKGERGDSIIVADKGGKPVGFLAIAKMSIDNQTVMIIDLIGVHPGFQGSGAGKQMVNHFITNSVGRCDLLRVGTQLINIPSIHLYEKAGFCMADATYVLHAHIRNGSVIP